MHWKIIHKKKVILITKSDFLAVKYNYKKGYKVVLELSTNED